MRRADTESYRRTDPLSRLVRRALHTTQHAARYFRRANYPEPARFRSDPACRPLSEGWRGLQAPGPGRPALRTRRRQPKRKQRRLKRQSTASILPAVRRPIRERSLHPVLSATEKRYDAIRPSLPDREASRFHHS